MRTQSSTVGWARQGATGAPARRQTSMPALADLPALDLIDAPEWADPDWRAASLAHLTIPQAETVRTLPPMPPTPPIERPAPSWSPRPASYAGPPASSWSSAPSSLPRGYVPIGQRSPGRSRWYDGAARLLAESDVSSPSYAANSASRMRAPYGRAGAGERARRGHVAGIASGIPSGAAYDDSDDYDDFDDYSDATWAADKPASWEDAWATGPRPVYTDEHDSPSRSRWRAEWSADADAPLAARVGGALAALGVWLLRLACRRPTIQFPGLVAGRVEVGERTLRLPPVWLLFNLSALLLIVLGLIPTLSAPVRAEACGWYTVHSGDTAEAIAAHYHVSTATIISRNHLMTPPQLLVGEQLCLPTAGNADIALAAIPQPKAQPTLAASPSNAAQSVSGEAAFVAFALPYAEQAHQALGWPVSVILAQWGLEHGWKLPGFTGYNFGNVAAIPGEQTTGGTAAWGSPAAFSYAPTPDAGVREYIEVGRLGYYSGVAQAAHNGADAAAAALGQSPWDAGHYTGDGNPGDSLIRIMRDFNLYQYDQ